MAEFLNWYPFGCGKNEVLMRQHLWIIDNFTGQTRLESPKFPIGDIHTGYIFGLHFFEIVVDSEPWYQYSISVEKLATNPPDAIAEHKFAVVDSHGGEPHAVIQKIPTGLSVGDFIGVRFIKKKVFFNKPEIYLLSENTLKLNYHIRFIVLENTLLQDFKILFNKQERSDVKFVVDGKEFTAHKTILSARSVVFATMFEAEMREKLQNEVVIEDIDPEVFQELLRFMYTDQVEKLDVHAFELLKAAHKYELQRLKSLCEGQLLKIINVENCAVLFAASDLYKCLTLKDFALNFIIHNAKAVMNTEEYETMAKEHPHLILEAFKELAYSSKIVV